MNVVDMTEELAERQSERSSDTEVVVHATCCGTVLPVTEMRYQNVPSGTSYLVLETRQ